MRKLATNTLFPQDASRTAPKSSSCQGRKVSRKKYTKSKLMTDHVKKSDFSEIWKQWRWVVTEGNRVQCFIGNFKSLSIQNYLPTNTVYLKEVSWNALNDNSVKSTIWIYTEKYAEDSRGYKNKKNVRNGKHCTLMYHFRKKNTKKNYTKTSINMALS